MRGTLAVLGSFVLSGVVSAQSTDTVAVTGVTVVDIDAAALRPGRTIVIAGDRILAVTDAPPAGARILDGSGRFAIPGLWDMHVHLRHPIAPTVLMPQFIAHGVTGVRDMASDCDGPNDGDVCAQQMLEWRGRIERGELPGPRLLALSSFPLNPPWDYEVTEEQARAVVRAEHERGLQWIKTYFRLSPEAFGWVADEAAKVGMRTGGHIPLRMTAAAAAEAGLNSLEHARDFLFDCFPGSAAFRTEARSQNPPIDVMWSMVDDHDVALCDTEFAALIRNGTWYVPTHVTRRMDAFADDPAFRSDPRQRWIPAPLWEDWQRDADGMVALDSTAEGRRVMRAFYTRGLEITGRAHRAGVKVLLGTDAGDTYVFPGSGVHDELGELVKAGLTPAEALAAATTRAAEFLGRSDFGAIAPGMHADIVLLDADPLTDIGAVRRIAAVIFQGRAYDRAALDAMLRDVEREAGAR